MLTRVRIQTALTHPRPLMSSFQRPLHSQSTRFAPAAGNSARPPVLRVVQSNIHEAYFNIALEERLFAAHTQRRADESPTPSTVDHTLFLWCNKPCVIMGKHQNPYREVHMETMRKEGVDLVRRKSGGGCVYQDAGNAIFTFISRDVPEAKEEHNDILLQSLKKLGVTAKASGRNDIEVADSGRKISGCAFKRDRGWLMHHGTMLIDVDMQALPRFLSPSKAKLAAKGVASVAARVTNLKTLVPILTNTQWDRTLADTFRTAFGPNAQVGEVEHFSDKEAALKADPELARVHDELKSFEWVYGSSPEFTHEFSNRFSAWGSVDIGFKVGKGHVIEAVNIYSDSLTPAMIECVKQNLQTLMEQKRPYGRAEVERVLVQAEEQAARNLGADAASNVKDIREWLLTHL
jgi:lipoate-protein ligase A